jgi:hypothetical protein
VLFRQLVQLQPSHGCVLSVTASGRVGKEKMLRRTSAFPDVYTSHPQSTPYKSIQIGIKYFNYNVIQNPIRSGNTCPCLLDIQVRSRVSFLGRSSQPRSQTQRRVCEPSSLKTCLHSTIPLCYCVLCSTYSPMSHYPSGHYSSHPSSLPCSFCLASF